MHLLLPFDYRVFTPILEKLRKHVQTRSILPPASSAATAAPVMSVFDEQTEKDLKEFDLMAEKFTVQGPIL